jgi:hypothetical protein
MAAAAAAAAAAVPAPLPRAGSRPHRTLRLPGLPLTHALLLDLPLVLTALAPVLEQMLEGLGWGGKTVVVFVIVAVAIAGGIDTTIISSSIIIIDIFATDARIISNSNSNSDSNSSIIIVSTRRSSRTTPLPVPHKFGHGG